MNKSMLAVLNDTERLLVTETEPSELDALDEDAVVELHTRVRRARNKYIGQYRRQASARVPALGGRGLARPKNQRAAIKAEVFEAALARVSRRLAVLARRSASDLRTERIDAARAARRGKSPGAAERPRPTGGTASGTSRRVTATPTGDRALRSPASEKNRGGTRAAGDRRQAKRDAR